jgi:hypothetical protein
MDSLRRRRVCCWRLCISRLAKPLAYCNRTKLMRKIAHHNVLPQNTASVLPRQIVQPSCAPMDSSCSGMWGYQRQKFVEHTAR